jgi:hypothetical protein
MSVSDIFYQGAEKLKELGDQFVAFVSPLLEKIRTILARVLDFITKGFSVILDRLDASRKLVREQDELVVRIATLERQVKFLASPDDESGGGEI